MDHKPICFSALKISHHLQTAYFVTGEIGGQTGSSRGALHSNYDINTGLPLIYNVRGFTGRKSFEQEWAERGEDGGVENDKQRKKSFENMKCVSV